MSGQDFQPSAEGNRQMGSDHEIALMEGHRIPAVDAYFKARPSLDGPDGRKSYEAGYQRGWRDSNTAHPVQPQPKGSDADVLELSKWLNEEPNRPVDRGALARLLHAVENAQPVGEIITDCDGEAVLGDEVSWRAGMPPAGTKLYTAPVQAPAVAPEVPAGFALIPLESSDALLRPFYECPPEELRLAWQAMHMIARKLHPASARPVPMTPHQRSVGLGESNLTDDSPQSDVWHAASVWTERAHGIGVSDVPVHSTGGERG